MNEKTIDLKQLLFLIFDQKESKANLNLDEGCTFEADDPKPLIKILNYLINFLDQLTENPIEISLDLEAENFRLNMLAYTANEAIPPISDNLQDALNDYHATFKSEHHSGSYLQFTVLFKK